VRLRWGSGGGRARNRGRSADRASPPLRRSAQA
jgi:hypothetical protein